MSLHGWPTSPAKCPSGSPWSSRWAATARASGAIDTSAFANSTRIATGSPADLRQLGVPRGARLALLVRPGIDFIALVFAVFKAGAVAILIDPGMGRRNLVRSLADARPQGFIAIPLVHAVRALLRGRFPGVRWKSRPAAAGSGAALRSISCAAARGARVNWLPPRPTTRPR